VRKEIRPGRGSRAQLKTATAARSVAQLKMASLAARALATAAARPTVALPTARLAPVRLASTVAAPATAAYTLERWAKPAPPQAPTRKTPEERRAARARALGRPVKQQGAATGRSSAKLPLLSLPEALKVLRASTRARFDETVEVALGCKVEKGYVLALHYASFCNGLRDAYDTPRSLFVATASPQLDAAWRRAAAQAHWQDTPDRRCRTRRLDSRSAQQSGVV